MPVLFLPFSPLVQCLYSLLMNIEHARVIRQEPYRGDYRLLVVETPDIASVAAPGQFIHIRVPGLESAVLRRPFSLFKAEENTVSVLFKVVGKGTLAMVNVGEGDEISLIGPLGNGFPVNAAFPILVAGGYGVAPLYFLGTRLATPGILFVGGATADDVLCVEEFQALGWDVRISTDDGSAGTMGLVTEMLDEWLLSDVPDNAEFFACGPDGMLKAVGERGIAAGKPCWLSLDKHMGCGVGACLACVQRIRSKDGSEVWARVCKDGPVFEASEIVW